MNILFITEMKDLPFAGTRYSVPRQIESIAKIANVCWLNINKETIEEWENLPYYYSMKNMKCNSIDCLKEPFNKPDIIIFEEYYIYRNFSFIRDVYKKKIPYVIVPRSQLTRQCYERRKLKKIIGNILFYNKFKNKAASVQFLTEDEKNDSKCRYTADSFVVPNGLATDESLRKRQFPSGKIKVVFIGRMDVNQKGLDYLFDAILMLSKEDRQRFQFDLYGNIQHDDITSYIKGELTSCVKYHGEIYGEDKAKVLADADFFILTSRFEGLPMGLLEALNYSLPCIISRGTNMVDVVNESKCGFTCETNTLEIKDCLENVLHGDYDYSEMSENAYKLSLKYNWDSIAKKTLKELERIINNKRGVYYGS